MIGILEAGRKAFEQYKEDVISGILYGLAMFLVGVLSLIPILGAFIVAYLGPRIANWYYNKTIGNIKTDYSLAFKVWLIYALVLHVVFLVGLFFAGTGLIISLTEGFGGFAIDQYIGMFVKLGALLGILLLVLFIFSILYVYTMYASVLGKISEIKIEPKKSVYLTVYFIVWSILLAIIAGILGAIPFIGWILVIVYQLFFMYPFLALIGANFVLSS
ncbi:MAG: hypothetical protein BXU00_00840 [Candidatus Nanoclepta minutus]|uniref:DUF4013 domain-containing protein n=1 Tax=Candidatus Nanoclepta minutus TaxID=1940235 RepID=A0A397WRE0_9ARCH|nr:MAG: hypothetical protein BXU00_00840 [Candidatus Nanoclepta minutus]